MDAKSPRERSARNRLFQGSVAGAKKSPLAVAKGDLRGDAGCHRCGGLDFDLFGRGGLGPDQGHSGDYRLTS